METSIIIRVKNEKENLAKLLKILKNQTYQHFELVIVNNNSTDDSDKAVYDYFSENRIQIINIKKFSYPKACNLGAEKAKGKYLVYLSAHSFPISNTWLESGLQNFKNEKVAGVFAFPIADFYSTISEKIAAFFNKMKSGGHLGNTNSIIRKSFWEKHKFNESLIESEDYEWSLYWEKKGYLIINDPRITVRHSHHLGPIGMIKRNLRWKNQNKIINELYY